MFIYAHAITLENVPSLTCQNWHLLHVMMTLFSARLACFYGSAEHTVGASNPERMNRALTTGAYKLFMYFLEVKDQLSNLGGAA